MGNQGNKMKKRILVRGPVLSQSGYGEQARFAMKSLRTQEDIYEIYIIPTGWGATGWVSSSSEERKWLDKCIFKTARYIQEAQQQKVPLANSGLFDVSLQITIPNEWENLAPINIGYTAGIETTKVSPEWLMKVNMMDQVIVVSNHSKQIFEKTTYLNQNNPSESLACRTPIHVVNYSVRKNDPVDINLNLDYDFNFLTMCQWGPRKNLNNTIKWFMEENFDREVGLVIKTSLKNNCLTDREFTEHTLKNILKEYKDNKCKVYLLHGDMSESELAGLYTHPQIKAIISATHGEGFGLPLFEAACHALPVISPGWSGQCDFLYMPDNRKGKKNKTRPMFASVEYDIQPVQKEAVWDTVIQKDSAWCFPRESSFKRRIREVYTKIPQFKRNAKKLQKWILEEFSSEKKYKEFCKCIDTSLNLGDDFYKESLQEVVISSLM